MLERSKIEEAARIKVKKRWEWMTIKGIWREAKIREKNERETAEEWRGKEETRKEWRSKEETDKGENWRINLRNWKARRKKMYWERERE